MEANEHTIKLDYNTERVRLRMPEYGRNVLRMVEMVKHIEDRDKRTAQARAIVKVMERLNPSVKADEHWEQKLWDHLYIMAGFDLDVDSPYPVPTPEQLEVKPMPIPLKKRPIISPASTSIPMECGLYTNRPVSVVMIAAERP